MLLNDFVIIASIRAGNFLRPPNLHDRYTVRTLLKPNKNIKMSQKKESDKVKRRR